MHPHVTTARRTTAFTRCRSQSISPHAADRALLRLDTYIEPFFVDKGSPGHRYDIHTSTMDADADRGVCCYISACRSFDMPPLNF